MNPRASNLVVLSPNWLGDAVMALPALGDVRRHFAEARLTVAARGAVASLFEMVPGVDAVLRLPGRGGLAAVSSSRQEAAALSAGAFDAALLFPNSFASALAVRRAGVAERWGTATDWRRGLLTRAVPKPRGPLHQAAYYQALVFALGIPNGPAYARVAAPAGVESPAPTGPYVVLAPGAAYGKAKQWPIERFAELAGLLLSEGRSVVLVGSRADRSTCGRIVAAAPAPGKPDVKPSIVDLTGQTTLGQLVTVMDGAEAVVSNDSGAMHLAGAVGAPVVAVFGATNELRTAPLTNGPAGPPPRIVTTTAWCRPCMLRECPIDHRCMTGVSARMVHLALARFRETT